ncbi:hypothetical protein QVD99_007695 [Batrachochytrium dendrobatidis]|nr:hypothetical protein O5D80_001350 [Batrachochytrium dendrobatidis]KAK5665339.1 hypothetical protein QVD99_007695 [Batrachochytrium dendrobatidis]
MRLFFYSTNQTALDIMSKTPEDVLQTMVEQTANSYYNSPSDLVVSFIHAAMTGLGFDLIGNTGDQASLSKESTADKNKLPFDWNASTDAYSLSYLFSKTLTTYLVKAVKMGNKLIVHGMNLQDESVHDFTVGINTVVASSAVFPFKVATADPQTLATPWESTRLSLLFVSRERAEQLLHDFKSSMIDALLKEQAHTRSGQSYKAIDPMLVTAHDSIIRDHRPPLSIRPDTETKSGTIETEFNSHIPNRFGVGDVDLDPLAAAPGMMNPIHGFPKGFGSGPMHPGGGMIVGPDHPMFNNPVNPLYSAGGSPGFPPGAVPPGARFDPVGPFGQRPNRYGGFPNRQPGQFSGDPDNDDLLPPGHYDMYM